MEENEVEKDTMQSLKELVETELKDILDIGIQEDNIDNLGKLIDIHKDIANENYWKVKEDNMRNRMYGANRYSRDAYGTSVIDNYGNYGRRMRDSRGRYMESKGYDRRPDSRYGNRPMRIYDIMDGWEDYRDGMDEYRDRGSYGAKEKGLESLEFMLDAFVKWFEDISREAETQEEVDLIKKYAKKIKDM